ncbi:MAG TPA: sugar ABC transporter permease [Jatrophihabitans sp.]|nr:sugar ABC transporter permease [Jatrophihabitans sp.]
MTATTGQVDEQAVHAGGARGRRKRRARATRGDSRLAWRLIAPTIVLLLVVIGYPVVYAVVKSLQLDKADAGINPKTGFFEQGGKYVGLKYYRYWFHCNCPNGTTGHEFWPALQTTVIFTVITVAFEVVLGVMMALVMHRAFKGRGIVRAAILIPWAIPTAVTAKLWYYMFQPQGVVNAVLGTNIIWLGSEWPARWAVMAGDIWKTTPFVALLVLAGLQVIPDELYESARVDGASAWQRFFSITLPLVKPALLVAVLFRVLDVLRIFDLPYILTQGANNTTTLSILSVQELRSSQNAAAALSTITFVFIFVVAFFLVKIFSVRVVETQARTVKA